MCLHLRQQPLTLTFFSARARSLNKNNLTDYGRDMSGFLKLVEALPHSQLTSLRWPTSPLNSAWTFCLYLPLRQQPVTRHAFLWSAASPKMRCAASSLAITAPTPPRASTRCVRLSRVPPPSPASSTHPTRTLPTPLIAYDACVPFHCCAALTTTRSVDTNPCLAHSCQT